jgi:choline kinase
MYSLALGLHNGGEPTWVLEGDVLFEASILELPAPPEIAWFADSATRHLDGAYLEADAAGVARSLRIVRDLNVLQPVWSKSCGILKLTAEGVRLTRMWLKVGIDDGRQNQYYDLVLADHMQDEAIRIVDVRGRKWFEVDTPADLELAARMFR